MTEHESWQRAPYGYIGEGRYLSIEAAKEALERGGYPTRMRGGVLEFLLRLNDEDPLQKRMLDQMKASNKGFSVSIGDANGNE